MQNSIVFHATSPSPYGPYTPVGPAITQPEASLAVGETVILLHPLYLQ